jgi:hypothetical protein
VIFDVRVLALIYTIMRRTDAPRIPRMTSNHLGPTQTALACYREGLRRKDGVAGTRG